MYFANSLLNQTVEPSIPILDIGSRPPEAVDVLSIRTRSEPCSDSTSKPSSLTSFTYFSEFPTEIKLEVYKRMVPGPRNVEIECRPTKIGHCFSRTPVPVVLHICSDSREEALKLFEPLLRYNEHMEYANGADRDDTVKAYMPQTIYINPVVDTLLLLNRGVSTAHWYQAAKVFSSFNTTILQKQRRIGIDVSILTKIHESFFGPYFCMCRLYKVDSFRSLEELKLVIVPDSSRKINGQPVFTAPYGARKLTQPQGQQDLQQLSMNGTPVFVPEHHLRIGDGVRKNAGFAALDAALSDALDEYEFHRVGHNRALLLNCLRNHTKDYLASVAKRQESFVEPEVEVVTLTRLNG